MSKILQAMNKSGVSGKNLADRLSGLGGVDLFPLPSAQTQKEFAKLANSLLVLASKTDGLVVAFASTVSGEGSSFVSFNVARHLSVMVESKIAWVDANFHKPQKKLFGQKPGLRELLLDPDLVNSLPPATANFRIIPNGKANIKTNELLKNDNYTHLVSGLKKSFFCTILDVSPVIDSTETVHLAQPTDGLVLVIQAGGLKHEVIKHGIQTISELGVSILGTVLNKRSFFIPKVVYERL